jgi:hypothetical protein
MRPSIRLLAFLALSSVPAWSADSLRVLGVDLEATSKAPALFCRGAATECRAARVLERVRSVPESDLPIGRVIGGALPATGICEDRFGGRVYIGVWAPPRRPDEMSVCVFADRSAIELGVLSRAAPK